MTINKQTVINAVLKGIVLANLRLEKWSHGAWVCDYGVEGFIGAQVAAVLRNEQDDKESLLLEVPFKEIREFSNAYRNPGRPKNVLKDRNRADIVLFNHSNRPVHVIELKRCWNTSSCFGDIERVLALLETCSNQKNGSLRYGYVAFLIVTRARTRDDAIDKVSTKSVQIETSVKNEFIRMVDQCVTFRMKLSRPLIYEEEIVWAAKACCLTFSKGRGNYIRRNE